MNVIISDGFIHIVEKHFTHVYSPERVQVKVLNFVFGKYSRFTRASMMVQSNDDLLIKTCPFNLFSALLLQPKFYMLQNVKG